MPAKSREYYIDKIHHFHPDYDCSQMPQGVKTKDKVKIGCPAHGTFECRVDHLCRGVGCAKCKGLALSETRKRALSFYIAKATEKHGGKYDYSLICEGVNSKSKVRIICPKHGVFEQELNSHLSGKGCPLCRNGKISAGMSKPLSFYITKATKKHDGKYDYSLIWEGVNSKSKVRIICCQHGGFRQELQSHIQGVGCPKCAFEGGRSKKEIAVADFVKGLFVNADMERPV